MDEILPLLPHGASYFGTNLSVINENNQWTYFHGGIPIFSHTESDNTSFRAITSSFLSQGLCKNKQVQNVFNVSKSSVIRNLNKFKSKGFKGFFANNSVGGKKKHVITDKVIAKSEELFLDGYSVTQIAEELSIKYDTLQKAITSGRIKKPLISDSEGSNKSQRSSIDSDASSGFGVACTNTVGRTLAAFGLLNNETSRFTTCNDVSYAGVLISLPALEANGLYYQIKEHFGEFKGYYSVIHILTLLGFMALCRVKTVEQLYWVSPGEFGKLIGLDRIPEARCLRQKIASLSSDSKAKEWEAELAKKWLDDTPDLSGVLYIDGHVRLYAGKEKIPKQYVSRERLCLKGCMDFWVNDKFGSPFFVIRNPINSGMIKTLKGDIVPRLLNDVPNQPDNDTLEKNLYMYRFILVFDREGYSPEFFKTMWDDHRISCITYNKYPKKDWDEKEFHNEVVELIDGNTTQMSLAERGTYLGVAGKGIWVKEIRKLTGSGHQTSVVSTIYDMPIRLVAVLMFARWSQENFFNYMMQNFAIDALGAYKKNVVPDTEMIVNPKWRQTERLKNSINGKLKNRKSKFTDFTLNPQENTGTKKYLKWEKKKQEIAEEIRSLEEELQNIKIKLKDIEKHIEFSKLDEADKFKVITPSSKALVDTIKMVAYRAETSMSTIIRKSGNHIDQSRAILQDIFKSDADIIPDSSNKTVNVRIHSRATESLNKTTKKLLDVLNETKTKFPGTNYVMQYQLIGAKKVSSLNPPDQVP